MKIEIKGDASISDAFNALEGNNETENSVEAYAQLDIAASGGNQNAKRKLEKLARTMLPSQITEAKAIAAKQKKQKSGEAVGLTTRRFDQLLKGARAIDNRTKAIKTAADLIDPLPEEDHALHLLLGDDFNAWDIVPAIIALENTTATAIYISTLGFNKKMAESLAELLESGDIRRAFLLCSHYFQATDRPTFRHAVDRLRGTGGKVNFARSHAKIICVDINGKKYVCEGSANLRNSSNVEQMTITQSAGLFTFHSDWIKRNVEKC